MRKSKNLPEFVTTVPSYEELGQFAEAFAAGHLNFLALLGNPGLGKSRCLADVLGSSAAWVNGTASAFGLYLHAYEHLNEPIVLDDVDGLYRDRAGIRILKSLCQTDAVKRLSWRTEAKTLESRKIPNEFVTRSRVAMIGNQWRSKDADVAAVEDRGHVIVFDPSALDVHRHASRWFWDPEVFDFVALHLHLIDRPSLRTYVLAAERKQAGLDWREVVLARCLQGTALEVARLRSDPKFATEEERVRAFVDRDLGCRATYFNHAKRLRPSEPVPEIRLAPRTTPATLDEASIDSPTLRLANFEGETRIA